MEYSVRIVDEDGHGVSGKKVTVHYPWTWSEDYTDEDGWVTFEKSGGGVTVQVYAGGALLGEVHAEDGDTFSFNV